MFALAILAVVGCAICNGTAAILQKIGADSQKKTTGTLEAGLVMTLLRNGPYVSGLILDLLGWGLTVFAVRYIPLFLAEAIIAAGVAVTALLDWIVLRHRLTRSTWFGISVLLTGLGLLGSSATRQTSLSIHGVLEWAVIITPVACLAAGVLLVRWRNRLSVIPLALLSGVAFGGTSVVGRVLPITSHWWRLLFHPLFWSLAIYGYAGVWLFTIALQRGLATTVNASMTAAQMLVPTIIGLIFLSDDIRGGLWLPLILGIACTLGGVSVIARTSLQSQTNKANVAR